MTQEREFLHLLFETLEEQKADYMVLRNYDTLPESVTGTDVDILVKKKFFRDTLRRLREKAPKIGYRVWKVYPKNFGMTQVSFAPKDIRETQEMVRIDFLFDKINWFGFSLLDAELLWKSRARWKGLWVLSDPVSTAVTLLNVLLYGGKVKEKYIKEYAGLKEKDRKNVDDLLSGTFGAYGKEIADHLRQGDLTELNTNRLRYHFLRKKRFHPVHLFQGLFSWMKTGMHRILHVPGLFVVFVGPDGCGKSTINEMLQDQCKRLYSGVDAFHLFPKMKIFRPIDRISERRYERRHANGSEWQLRRQPIPLWKSLLKSFYLILRFNLGYWFWIYPRLAKGHLVIGERWAYDLLLDPSSKGIRLPLWTRKGILFLCPKPGKTFSLEGSADKMAERKKELPSREIAKQLQKMKEALSNKEGNFFIDTTKEIGETLEDTLCSLVL